MPIGLEVLRPLLARRVTRHCFLCDGLAALEVLLRTRTIAHLLALKCDGGAVAKTSSLALTLDNTTLCEGIADLSVGRACDLSRVHF